MFSVPEKISYSFNLFLKSNVIPLRELFEFQRFFFNRISMFRFCNCWVWTFANNIKNEDGATKIKHFETISHNRLPQCNHLTCLYAFIRNVQFYMVSKLLNPSLINFPRISTMNNVLFSAPLTIPCKMFCACREHSWFALQFHWDRIATMISCRNLDGQN